jgi:GNAT superfamily N-acetyltransferase
MKLRMRKIYGENDYWKIRDFLRETFLLNDRKEINWQVARLDYCRWHVMKNCQKTNYFDLTYVWENEKDEIVAVLSPEEIENIHLQLHPDYKSKELIKEMIEVAEKNYPRSYDGNRKKERHIIWSHDVDDIKKEVLKKMGYQPTEWLDNQRYKPLDESLPKVEMPKGYSIRHMGLDSDILKRSWASFRAFHSEEPLENYEDDGGEWYYNIIKTPLYRRDLDLVAIAPEGGIVGFVTVWYDDYTRTGYFEPVGVTPSHQRQGIAKALILEGMKKLRELGAILAVIGGINEAANKTYSYMFNDKNKLVYRIWRKEY